MRQGLLFSQSGVSILQILIALGLAGILMLSVATTISAQQTMSARLSDKLASLDLERVVTYTLADGGVCTYMLTVVGSVTINPMNLPATVFPNLTEIPSKGAPGATPVLSTTSLVPVSPLSRRLFTQTLSISDLSCAVNPCTPTTNTFNANIVIMFDQTKLAAPLASMRFPITLITAGPPNAQLVTSCKGTGAGSFSIRRVVVDSAAESCGGSLHTQTARGCPPMLPQLARLVTRYPVADISYQPMHPY